MNLNKENKFVHYAAIVLVLSFCFCHFLFSYYCRLESDDYTFLAYIRDKGFFGTIKFIYLSWEGAFGVLIVSLLKIKMALLLNSVFLHNVICSIITFYCFYYFFKTCFSKFLQIETRSHAFLLTAILYSEVYYNDLGINDTWYWLCGSVYVFMPSLLLFFTAVIINNSNKFLIGLAYFYFFLYGASRLNYAAILLFILGSLFLYFFFKEKKIHKTLFILCSLVLVSLIMYVIAPGNYVRRSEELKAVLGLKDYLIGPIKMSVQYILKYLIFKAPYHLLFLFPAVYIGYTLKDQLSTIFLDRFKPWKIILFFSLFALACIYVQSLSMFIAKGSQTSRTLEMTSMIVSTCLAVIFMIFGTQFRSFPPLSYISMVCLFIASFFLIRRVWLCVPIIKSYSAAVDERHKTINEAMKNFTGDTL
jgi:hypothetical protein